MKKRKIIPAAFLALACAFTASACTAGPSGVYEYEKSEVIATDTNTFKNFTYADGMTIDGEREDVYGDRVYRLYYRNDETSSIYMDSYIYFGETGVHCFVEVHDNIVSYNSKRAVYYNSSVELFFNDITKTSINNKTCQYRIAAGGKFSKLCGVGGRSTYTTSYFDGQFATKILGEMNTTTAQGFNVEAYIPWYELGFDSADDVTGISFYPAYNRVADPQGRENLTSRVRTTKKLTFQATPHSWVPVLKTESGAGKDATFSNDFFGVADGYESSYGFSQEENGDVVLSSRSSASFLFKKDYCGSKFYYECRISDLDGLASGAPKAGVTVFLFGNRVTLYVKKSDQARVGIVQRNSANSDWNWTVEENGTYTNQSYLNTLSAAERPDYLTDGVKLAVYRDGNEIYFFVNDLLMFATEDTTCTPLAGVVSLHDTRAADGEDPDDSIVGVYSYSATIRISDYSFASGSAATEKFTSLLAE